MRVLIDDHADWLRVFHLSAYVPDLVCAESVWSLLRNSWPPAWASSASKWCREDASEPIMFRPGAARTFDDTGARRGSWQCKNLTFACAPDPAKALVAHRTGETGLVHRDGRRLLLATRDISEPELFDPADSGLGIVTRPPPRAVTTTGPVPVAAGRQTRRTPGRASPPPCPARRP